MPFKFDSKLLEEMTYKPVVSQIQNFFESLVSDLSNYLGIDPINKIFKIYLTDKKVERSTTILDIGVSRIYNNNVLELTIPRSTKFLPLIILREVYYRFLPKEIKDVTVEMLSLIAKNELLNEVLRVHKTLLIGTKDLMVELAKATADGQGPIEEAIGGWSGLGNALLTQIPGMTIVRAKLDGITSVYGQNWIGSPCSKKYLNH